MSLFSIEFLPNTKQLPGGHLKSTPLHLHVLACSPRLESENSDKWRGKHQIKFCAKLSLAPLAHCKTCFIVFTEHCE